MLRDILYINKCNKKLKGTYKGMIEMLEDKIQFREFGEFCIKESCVENILFLEEYWKFKRLFNKNEKTISIIHDISRPFSVNHETVSIICDPGKSGRDIFIKSTPDFDSEENCMKNNRGVSTNFGETSIASLTPSTEPKVVDIKTLYSTIEKKPLNSVIILLVVKHFMKLIFKIKLLQQLLLN